MTDTEPSLTNFTQGRLLFCDKQAKEAATLPYGCPCRSYCCMRYTVNSCDASAGSGDTRISTAGMKTMKVRGNEDLNMLSNTSLASSNIVATVLGTKLKIKRPVELSPLPQTDSQPQPKPLLIRRAVGRPLDGKPTSLTPLFFVFSLNRFAKVPSKQ